jgi:hypothetical protein
VLADQSAHWHALGAQLMQKGFAFHLSPQPPAFEMLAAGQSHHFELAWEVL